MRDGPWKVGHLWLTNKRLIFLQANKAIFRVMLDDVIDVGIRKGRFILGSKKPLLFVLYGKEKQMLTWFAINDVTKLENEIRKAVVMLRVTPDTTSSLENQMEE